MVVISISMHPKGLPPMQAAKAWYLRREEEKSWSEIQQVVVDLSGQRPGIFAIRNAVERVDEMKAQGKDLPTMKYGNCGRKKDLTPEEQKAIIAFVAKWRHKRFCTCSYLAQELKLKVSKRTIARTLNAHGYFWRPVPKLQGLCAKDLGKRKEFVEEYCDRPTSWWEQHMNLVLDGVTLTMAPKPLNAKEKHAAQRIMHMWTRKGEALNNDIHTHNRYGVQLGTKVPLWGGFTGRGKFTLRLWTPKAKMTKAEWERRLPVVREAASEATVGEGRRGVKRRWVWHDNERFLLCPEAYKRNGMQLIRFPPNSGDLNPIETVWARLRKDLAVREQADVRSHKVLTVAQFRARAAQLLQSYSVPANGQQLSYLQKLVRGMPDRLRRCRANKYGRCGK